MVVCGVRPCSGVICSPDGDHVVDGKLVLELGGIAVFLWFELTGNPLSGIYAEPVPRHILTLIGNVENVLNDGIC